MSSTPSPDGIVIALCRYIAIYLHRLPIPQLRPPRRGCDHTVGQLARWASSGWTLRDAIATWRHDRHSTRPLVSADVRGANWNLLTKELPSTIPPATGCTQLSHVQRKLDGGAPPPDLPGPPRSRRPQARDSLRPGTVRAVEVAAPEETGVRYCRRAGRPPGLSVPPTPTAPQRGQAASVSLRPRSPHGAWARHPRTRW